jgi:hypothetical protein
MRIYNTARDRDTEAPNGLENDYDLSEVQDGRRSRQPAAEPALALVSVGQHALPPLLPPVLGVALGRCFARAASRVGETSRVKSPGPAVKVPCGREYRGGNAGWCIAGSKVQDALRAA